MAILIDTQALLWFGTDNPRLSEHARLAILDPEQELLVSAVTAYEFVDLHLRGRFGEVPHLRTLLDRLDAQIIPLPAGVWELIETLPDFHRDPVDRMLVSHAILADLTLITANATLRRYPVRSLW